MGARVLLIDDDVELVDLLRDFLVREGFEIAVAHDGTAGVNAALSGCYDIAVLDVMMPGISGIQALGMIRAASAMPVIMLTARGDDMDRIVGLELGADDYVAKPCMPRELSARLRAILKRTGPAKSTSASAIIVGNLSIWPAQRRAELSGKTINLTSTEFSLLEELARHAGLPVNKVVLSEQALGRPLTRFDRSIDVHISSIRHKLGPLSDGRPRIQTVIRKGYLLVVE
jgi:two-component system OmpR family response regulator/two-component system response regulator CpxR